MRRLAVIAAQTLLLLKQTVIDSVQILQFMARFLILVDFPTRLLFVDKLELFDLFVVGTLDFHQACIWISALLGQWIGIDLGRHGGLAVVIKVSRITMLHLFTLIVTSCRFRWIAVLRLVTPVIIELVIKFVLCDVLFEEVLGDARDLRVYRGHEHICYMFGFDEVLERAFHLSLKTKVATGHRCWDWLL